MMWAGKSIAVARPHCRAATMAALLTAILLVRVNAVVAGRKAITAKGGNAKDRAG